MNLSYVSSIIRDGRWIWFPGWDGGKNSVEIWSMDYSDFNDVIWTEIPNNRSDAYFETAQADSYAFAHIEPYVYFHGGYNENYPTGNFMARINLEEDPLNTEIISYSIDMPSGRSYHSLTAVGNKLYMFGGHDGEKTLDELWSYDVGEAKWDYIPSFGINPSKRMGHAATSHGANLLIWGGRDGVTYFNDMYLYNVMTGAWKEMANASTDTPVAAEGA